MAKERELDILPLTRSPLPVSPFDDTSEGPGLHVRIGAATAHIFPEARTARAELHGDRARMTNLTRIEVTDDSVNMYGETEDYFTVLRVESQAVVLVKGRKGATAPTIHSEAGQEAEAREDTSHEPIHQEGSKAQAKEERERITLIGRIGYTPKFRTTPKGTLVGTFSLAAHPAPGETVWHKIVVFGDRAQRMEDGEFGKGDEVEVVGYEHTRMRTDKKTGQKEEEIELYAAVVKSPHRRD